MKNMIIGQLIALLFVLAGCEDADPYFNRSVVNLTGTVATKTHLVMVDYAHNRALMLGLTEQNIGKVESVPVPSAPLYAEKRMNSDETLILSAGTPGNKDMAEQPAALTRLQSNGKKITYSLGSKPFDTLVASPDGRYVILMRRILSNFVLENMNEIAIVDMTVPPQNASAVIFKTLSGRPGEVFFSENFSIEGQARSIVAISSQGALFILDSSHFERQETTVYLGQNNDLIVVPNQVIFDSASPRLYVRANNADDIFSLRLTSRTVAENKNDFSTSIDIIGVGGTATDMSLYHENGNGYLFVMAAASGKCAIVNVATGRTFSLNLPEGLNRAYLFERGTGSATSRHALLYQDYIDGYYILDFAGLEEDGERNLHFMGATGQSQNETYPAKVDDRVLIMHHKGLTLLDLENERFAQYTSRYNLTHAHLDSTIRRFWVAPENSQQVAYLDMNDGSTGELIIDSAVHNVIPAWEAGKLIIEHSHPLGYVTIIDVSEPNRDNAVSVKGFLFNDVL